MRTICFFLGAMTVLLLTIFIFWMCYRKNTFHATSAGTPEPELRQLHSVAVSSEDNLRQLTERLSHTQCTGGSDDPKNSDIAVPSALPNNAVGQLELVPQQRQQRRRRRRQQQQQQLPTRPGEQNQQPQRGPNPSRWAMAMVMATATAMATAFAIAAIVPQAVIESDVVIFLPPWVTSAKVFADHKLNLLLRSRHDSRVCAASAASLCVCAPLASDCYPAHQVEGDGCYKDRSVGDVVEGWSRASSQLLFLLRHHGAPEDLIVEIELGLRTTAAVIDSATHAAVLARSAAAVVKSAHNPGNSRDILAHDGMAVRNLPSPTTAMATSPSAPSPSQPSLAHILNPAPQQPSQPAQRIRRSDQASRCPKNNTDWQWLSNWTSPTLNLTDCGLKDAPEQLFQLTTLVILDLHLNSFTSIPTGMQNLIALTYLDMANNQLTSIPEKLCRLTTLTHLDLHFNQLTSLPGEIGELSALTYLDVSFNDLTRMPAELGNIAGLATLGFGGARLTSLPAEMWALTALTKLYLSNNRLTALPAEIGHLTALAKLYLSDNSLCTLPAEIGRLINLTKLDLSNNSLSSLPEEIWQLEKLTRLYLSTNPLEVLPAGIGQLIALNKLYLYYTSLSQVPQEIEQLSNLTALVLTGNFLTVIPLAINSLANLKILRLEDNRIRTMSSLQALHALQYLYLSNNKLSEIPSGTFGSTVNVQVQIGARWEWCTATSVEECISPYVSIKDRLLSKGYMCSYI